MTGNPTVHRTLCSTLVLLILAACGHEVRSIAPAWHGTITVDCAGDVTVSSEPAGAVFVGTVTGVGTMTVTASGYLDWPDNDETPAVSAEAASCTPATTTTVAATTTTEELPPSTATSSTPDSNSVPPSNSSTPPSSVIPTTDSTTSTTTTTPAPTPEPFCVSHPDAEGCTSEGLPTDETG